MHPPVSQKLRMRSSLPTNLHVERVAFRQILPASSVTSTADPIKSRPIAIVGAGAVGTVLARRLVACGSRVDAIVSRRERDARSLADRVGASVASTDVAALPASVRVVFVCVPDDTIGAVADALSAVPHPWGATLVAHTSGAHGASALAPLDDRGASLLSFHPMQTFTRTTAPDAFDDIVVGVEGHDDAVAFGAALARHLGGRALTLSTEGKTYYHAAAALASNGLVALMAVVREVLAAAEVDADDATSLVRPLVEQTWTSLTHAPPEAVLTGPVARGDRGTVAAHAQALARSAPHLLPTYAALSTEMVRVAVRSGDLDADAAEGLLDVLSAALDDAPDDAPPPDGLL